MGDLAIYDRMCFAIAECRRVDEVKNLRDKAQAMNSSLQAPERHGALLANF